MRRWGHDREKNCTVGVLCAEEGSSRKRKHWVKQLGGRVTVGLAKVGIAVRIENGRDWVVAG